MRNIIFSFALFASLIAVFPFVFPNGAEERVQTTLVSQQGSSMRPANATVTDIPSDDMALLTAGAWKMASITSNKPCDTDYDGHFTTNVGAEMPSCAMDDVMKFHADGTVAFHRNERCDLTEQDVEKYNWFLSENNTLNIARGSVEAVMVLRSVSDQQLVVEIPMQDGGESHVFTVVYNHPATIYP